MNGLTILVIHACYSSVFRRNIEPTSCPSQDASNMGACCLKWRRHHCPDQVAGLIALHVFGRFGSRSRESAFVHRAHLSVAVSVGLDTPEHNAFYFDFLRSGGTRP